MAVNKDANKTSVVLTPEEARTEWFCFKLLKEYRLPLVGKHQFSANDKDFKTMPIDVFLWTLLLTSDRNWSPRLRERS